MSGYGGFSNAGSNNISLSNGKFDQNVWKPQGQALTNLYNNANALYDQTAGRLSDLTPGVFNNQTNTANMALNGANSLMNGGAYAGINANSVLNDIKGMAQNPSAMANTFSNIQPLGGNLQTNIMNLPGQIGTHQVDTLDMLRPMDSWSTQNRLLPNGLLNPMTGVGNMNNTSRVYSDIMGGNGNSYADAMKGKVMADAKGLADQSLNSLDQRAAAGGMGGSTRHGIAQANALSDINSTAQDSLNKIGYDTFNQDLNNKLAIAQQADTNATSRYNANLNYNTNLVNAGNVNAAQNLGYNTSLGGLANQANNNNLGYNLGYGQNVNANNQNAYNYGNNLYNAGTNYNIAATNANAMLGNGAMNLNGSLASLMPQFPAGQQMSMTNGLSAMPGVSGMYGMGLDSMMAPFQALGQYANAIGGPVVLGSGRSNGASQGSSNSMGVSGGGGSVICTELHRQGLMSDQVHAADEVFGEMIRAETPDIYAGYVAWAPRVVKAMRKSKLLTRAINVLGAPWAKEMHRRVTGKGRVNPVGWVVMEVGLAVCGAIGAIKKAQEA